MRKLIHPTVLRDTTIAQALDQLLTSSLLKHSAMLFNAMANRRLSLRIHQSIQWEAFQQGNSKQHNAIEYIR